MSLIFDVPSKMPSYMGFFVSKAISQAWALAKHFDSVPKLVPFEKQIGFALLAGLIGFVSVKRAQIEGAKRMKEEAKEKKKENENKPPIFYHSSCVEGGPEQLIFRRGGEVIESRQAGGSYVPDDAMSIRPRLRRLARVEVEFLLGTLT